MTAAHTHYVIHHGNRGYGVRAVAQDMIVWQALDASAGSAAYLAQFLNSHARHLPASQVRAQLTPLGSDLATLRQHAEPDAADQDAERAS